MALTVKHTFVSAKGDGSDATLLRPSNWNANHDIELASNKIIGRLAAGPGDAEELPVTPYMIALLNTADYASLAVLLGLPTTGDARLTFKQTTADPGWVFANDGSIGDVGSGASTRAHADTRALFTFFYDTMYEGFAPLQTSSGAATTRVAQGSATTAFNAKCRMVLPKTLGRAIVAGGATPGAGLTQRWAGQSGGEESHVLSMAEMPYHNHTGTPTGTIDSRDLNHYHAQTGTFTSGGISANHTHTQTGTFGSTTDSANHTHTQQGSFGSGWQSADHAHYTGGTNSGTTQHDYPDHTHSYTEAYDNYVGVRWFDNHFEKAIRAAQTGGASARHQHNFDLAWGAWSGGVNTNHYHVTTIGGETGTVSAWHTHNITISGQTGAVSADHTHNTTIGGTTGWMNQSNIHNHGFVGDSMSTTYQGGNVAHNIMQPWVGLNVMIKL
jgi:hypothetical protein